MIRISSRINKIDLMLIYSRMPCHLLPTLAQRVIYYPNVRGKLVI